MANQVYANGREISCKAADGKSIAAFPDVCFTPPQTPATPPGVPIPYPNTGVSSDTSDGSKNVKISGKEIMMKDSSPFSKTTGNEAGNAPKKGVITSKNTGKAFFNSWSMDVKVEGSNVVRHLDIMTHNHGSKPGNTPPWVYTDRMAMSANLSECDGVNQRVSEQCNPWKQKAKCPGSAALDKATALYSKELKKLPTDKKKRAQAKKTSKSYQNALKRKHTETEKYAKRVEKNKCHQALRCVLVAKGTKKSQQCCPPQTPHHLIPASSFAGVAGYDYQAAPCVCAEGADNTSGTHGLLHTQTKRYINKWNKTKRKGTTWKLSDAIDCGASSLSKVFPNAKCDTECTKAQLKAEHQKMNIKPNTVITQSSGGGTSSKSDFERDWSDLNNDLRQRAQPVTGI
jgi:hypothetical protein